MMRTDCGRLHRRALLRVLAAIGVAGFAEGAQAEGLASLAHALVELAPPQTPPALSFTTGEGARQTLANYHGKAIVLNLWATWCAPCVAEMSALNGLAAAVANSAIVVLPVSLDVQGVSVVKPFYVSHHLTDLPVLLDPESDIAQALNVQGIPTTFIMDREHRIVGRVQGGVAWDRPAAIARIRKLAGPEA